MKTRFFFSLALLASLSLWSSANALEVSQKTEATATATSPNGTATVQANHNAAARTASATDLVKMHDAGLDVSVIRAYVQTLRVPYKASSDDILYLHDHKIPDDVIADWIKKGADLVGLAARVPASSPDLAAGTVIQNPAVVQGQQPQVIYQPAETAPTVVYASPSYAYSYWDYSYPYWYSPIGLSFSWGWGYPYYYRGGHYYYGGYHGGYHGGYYGNYHGGYNHGTVHTGYGGHPGGYGGGAHFTGGGAHMSGGHIGGGFGGGGHMGGGFGGGGHGGGGHR